MIESKELCDSFEKQNFVCATSFDDIVDNSGLPFGNSVWPRHLLITGLASRGVLEIP